jgi:predicted RND superfamily exporter protein
MGAAQNCSASVNRAFYKAFYNWGHFIGRCPFLVIVLSGLLGVLGGIRLPLATRFPIESVIEQEDLWVPQQAQAVTDKARYDAIFTNAFRRNTIYFTTKPRGGNVLTSSILSEVRRFDRMVTEGINASGYGTQRTERLARTYTALHDSDLNPAVEYNDVCARSTIPIGRNLSDPDDEGGIPCILFGHPLEIFYRIGGGTPRDPLWLPGDFNFDFTDDEINTMLTSGKGPDTTLFPEGSNRTINVETSYGGITRDANGKITGAKAIAMTYLLDEKPSYTTERYAAEAWEDQLNLLIGPSPNGELWSYPDLSEGSVGHWEGAKTPTLTRGGLQWESTLIDIFPQTSGATSRELGKNIRGDLLAVQISFFIIMIYAIFIFSRCHPVKSRVLLAISGCASVGLSIAVAYGFTALLGFKLNPVVQVLPFVLIGIGVDDMFVLTAALEAQPTDLPVKERMARAMGSAGVSITITSLTDLFAFALGATSALPALSTFCVFAAIGITADFLLQISFFAGFMAWDAYREKKRKVDCCPCCLPKGTDAENGCCCFGCCFGMFNCVKAVKGGYCAKIPGLNMIMTLMVVGLKAWMVNYYIPLMRNKFCKGTVILAFTAFTGLSAAYASQLKQDFQFRWFVNDDAPLQQAFDVQDDYFALSGLPVYVVTPSSSDFEYHTIAGQQKLLSMSAAIDGNRWIEADSVSDWYPMFREWVHACGTTETFDAGPLSGTSCVRKDCSYTYGGVTRYIYPYCTSEKELRDAGGNNLVDANGFDINGAAEAKTMVLSDGATAAAPGAALETTFIPPAKFWKWLDQFLADAPLGAITASEIVWLSNSTSRTPAQIAQGISATRIRATYIATDKADDQVASMVDLRADVTAVGLGDSFPYMFMYLYYEQYAIILREALTNLGLALVAVTIIVTLVLANFTATLLVMLCVVLVDCDILGLMQMWGLTIDSVAIINLVLAIGLAVDYSCHIAHSFLQTKGTRQERVDHALEEMGTAVVHGAFSTFLAVLVLSASKSYIFRIFFKQFFGICVFGAAHGLVLLPTLLSLIGPAYVEFKDDDTKEDDLKGVDIPEVGSTPPSAPPSAPGSECGDRDNYRSMITPRSISPAKVVPSTAF